MARTGTQISDGMYAALVSAASAVGITINPRNWSKTDVRKLTLDVVSDSQAIQEHLYDSLIEDTEDVASRLPPSTALYIQHMMKNVFEFDAITIPIVQLSPELVPYYPNPNPKQRIIDYCSVTAGPIGSAIVKIAAAGPTKITGSALNSAQTFATFIGVSSIIYSVVSRDPDELFLELDVYYNGLYSAVIQTNVTAAIDAYFSNLPFDGKISVLDLEIAIRNVTGVNSVVTVNMKVRDALTSISGALDMVLDKKELEKDFQTVAGYIVRETTVGFTLSDNRVSTPLIKNLNLIAE